VCGAGRGLLTAVYLWQRGGRWPQLAEPKSAACLEQSIAMLPSQRQENAAGADIGIPPTKHFIPPFLPLAGEVGQRFFFHRGSPKPPRQSPAVLAGGPAIWMICPAQLCGPRHCRSEPPREDREVFFGRIETFTGHCQRCRAITRCFKRNRRRSAVWDYAGAGRIFRSNGAWV